MRNVWRGEWYDCHDSIFLSYKENARKLLQEYHALPIRIGDGCWLGGGVIVIVLPGVSIGKGSVIGAGSVVTKDIPENSLAVGNPCRVVRKINGK